jgi:transcriptional regulator GlxA family with amidase domain
MKRLKRAVGFLVYPEFQLLDMSGPLAVFEVAGAVVTGSPYKLQFLSLAGGAVRSSAGVEIMTDPLENAAFDTLILPGGRSAVADTPQDLVAALKAIAPRCRRLASICTAAFILAHTGILDGRRATTHWRHVATLRHRHPRIRVDAEPFFINDGPVWTATGTNAGIDLALAMVEQDYGTMAARTTAQMMVVNLRRPGGQSQFAGFVEPEPHAPRIRKALDYARTHLHERLAVEDLAEVACLSPRQFSRSFAAETGLSPAKAVERLRAESARLRIENGSEPIEQIARVVGFVDTERMRRSFLRIFGQPPQSVRRAIRTA